MFRNLNRDWSAMSFVFQRNCMIKKRIENFLILLIFGSLIDGYLPRCFICLRDLAQVLKGALWLVENLFIICDVFLPYSFLLVSSTSGYRKLRVFIHKMVRENHWIRWSCSTWGPASYTPAAKENAPNSTEVDFMSEFELFGMWNLALNWLHWLYKIGIKFRSSLFVFF